MIKIEPSDKVLFKHIKYLKEDSNTLEKLKLFKEDDFFEEEYVRSLIEKDSKYENVLKLQKNFEYELELELNKQPVFKSKSELLNEKHKYFIQYLIDNIEKVEYDSTTQKILTRDLRRNLILAPPKELDTIYKDIMQVEFKIISFLLQLENFLFKDREKEKKASYSQEIISNLGYKRFSNSDMKPKLTPEFLKIDKLSKRNFYIEYIQQYAISESKDSINKNAISAQTLFEIRENIIKELIALNKNNIVDSEIYILIRELIEDFEKEDLVKSDGGSIGKDKFINLITKIVEMHKYKFGKDGLSMYETITLLNIHEYGGNSPWSAYQLVMELGVQVCPYCNRQYISPLYSEQGKVRADLDHFLPKYKYPYFSMSIYNLVPSCKFCNSSLKGTREFSYDSNLNPYEHGFNKLLRFTYKIKETRNLNNIKDIEIKLRDEIVSEDKKELIKKARRNAEIFQIENLYNYHKTEIIELIKKRIIYTESYIDNLYDDNKKIFKSRKEVVEFIIGNILNNINLPQKILSKLVNDIAEELGFLEVKLTEREIQLLKMKFDL